MQGQKGVAHILILFILVVGLLAGLYLSQKTQIFKPRAYSLSAPILPTPAPLNPTQTATATFDKKILAIVFDPVLGNGQQLSVARNWGNPSTLFNQAIDFFKRVSNNRVNYTIVDRIDVSDREFGWPEKEDGFRYDETTYLACIEGRGPCHNQPSSADIANYQIFINTYNVCERVNRGEIDEVWLMGGPWFGFYESRLAGPGAFTYNSPPLNGTSCNRLLPIMGFSYQTDYVNMIHNFGHRAEDTMRQVYGLDSTPFYTGEPQTSVATNWEKFALVKPQSTFNYGGCGVIHGGPNTAGSRNSRIAVDSICDDFYNYPNLTGRTSSISCRDWGCTDTGFYEWWFGHLPHFQGIGPDGKLNDWWSYIFDPNSNFTFNSPGY